MQSREAEVAIIKGHPNWTVYLRLFELPFVFTLLDCTIPSQEGVPDLSLLSRPQALNIHPQAPGSTSCTVQPEFRRPFLPASSVIRHHLRPFNKHPLTELSAHNFQLLTQKPLLSRIIHILLQYLPTPPTTSLHLSPTSTTPTMASNLTLGIEYEFLAAATIDSSGAILPRDPRCLLTTHDLTKEQASKILRRYINARDCARRLRTGVMRIFLSLTSALDYVFKENGLFTATPEVLHAKVSKRWWSKNDNSILYPRKDQRRLERHH